MYLLENLNVGFKIGKIIALKMCTNSERTRIGYIDVVAGVMIAWMILGHCKHIPHYYLSFYKYIGFFMPWFFYKSGMFFSVRDQALLLKRDASKLLRYFLVYSLIGWLVWCVCGLVDDSLTLNSIAAKTIRSIVCRGNIVGNGALWFLVSLFIVRQLSNWILKKNPPPRHCFCNMLCRGICIVWYRVV